LNESISWNHVLDLQALGGNNLTITDDYYIGLSRNATSTKANEKQNDVTRNFACHLTRGCGVKLALPKHQNIFCNKPFIVEESRSKGQQFPLSCLGHLLRGGESKQSVTDLVFSSMYNLIPQITKDPPIQNLVFNEKVERATHALAAFLFSGSSLQKTWCAHLRVGFSVWDSKPEAQFTSRWSKTVSAFDEWRNGMSKVQGLVLTDNTLKVIEDSYFCKNKLTKKLCVFEDQIDFNIPQLTGLSSPQKLAVLQRTCARASHLFLSTASSFSELIGVVHQDRTSKGAFNHFDHGDTSLSSVTFSEVHAKDDIFYRG
jgi:hypothetical protein